MTLHPGDKLFVYTDGIPEATNAEKELFGTERMVKVLNKDPNATPKQMLSGMHEAVKAFVQDAEQFDDLTMLALQYNGSEGADL